MIIEEVEMKDFRNYPALSIRPDPGINIFYGNNAQGKTNFLEAVYLCGTSRSHRGSKDREMIRFGCEEAHIRTEVSKKGRKDRIDLHLRRNKTKTIFVNRLPIHRASELFGILNLVFFSPEDLDIIKEGPAERRNFMDRELCQLDRIYLEDLKNYHKVLDQRNRLLKDLYTHPDLKGTLDVWDQQLVHYGSRIIERRQDFSDELNEISHEIHSGLTKKQEDMEVIYQPSCKVSDFSDLLRSAREKDIRFAQTSLGPHRDDLLIRSNGIEMRKFGSQGQKRTCALSLKLSEIRLVEEMIKDKPVLLMDDVLSELDQSRQDDLLSGIGHIQTFITCTGMEDFIRRQFPVNKVFHVTDGKMDR